MQIKSLEVQVECVELEPHFKKLLSKAAASLERSKLASWIAIDPDSVSLNIESGQLMMSVSAKALGRIVPVAIGVEPKINNTEHPLSIGFSLRHAAIFGAGNEDIASLISAIIAKAASEKLSAFAISCGNATNDYPGIFWLSLASILQRFGAELKGNVTDVVLSGKSLLVKIG